jgi:hypothetical protein
MPASLPTLLPPVPVHLPHRFSLPTVLSLVMLA